jgi:hypothetical protein
MGSGAGWGNRSVSSCPICEQPIPGGAEHCVVCGFPTGLAIEGLRAAQTPLSDSAEAADAPAPAVPRARPAPPPEAELTAALGRGLRQRMEVLRPLGGDAPNVTSEMCEAALGEASGRINEALEILRGAQNRLDRQARDALHRRWEAADDRRKSLERTGVRLELTLPEPDGSGDAMGDTAGEFVRRLVDAERRLGRFEADWKGLQGLLSQIESLRVEASESGIDLGALPGEIDRLRQKLSAGPFRESDLDAASEEAARLLMMLHEAIPAALEEELARHGAALGALTATADSGDAARRLHEEASRHLAKGRLVEASQSLRDLRRAIAEAEHPTAPQKPAAAPPPAPRPTDDAMLEVLLKKARSLAGRVRTLPADSTLALEAAAQIRAATDLLRHGRMVEADQTLTELMRMLSREGGKS